ncbi:MAG: hypothetical protein IJ189_03840 [Clostridia bacterium]|nr:hypothetical protein [Clostridia bacterium]
MEQLGYRLFSGRQGASGYIRAVGGQAVLYARGLKGEAVYGLYTWPEGREIRKGTTDTEGSLMLQGSFPNAVFLSDGQQVALWEGEEDAYLAACACLRSREERGEERPKENASFKINEQEDENDHAPALTVAATRMPETPDEEPPEYLLRPAGEGAPVDALPPIIWPKGAESIRRYAETYPLMAPFDAPGWRFVRSPSPLKQAVYCAVGYCVENDRVTAIAYAIPGTPYRPPAALPGYRYQQGKNGVGYWVLWKQV